MALSSKLNQRVRAHKGGDDDEDFGGFSEEEDAPSGEEVEEGDERDDDDDASEGSENEDEDEEMDDISEEGGSAGEESDSGASAPDVQSTIKDISFGALAKAQETMGNSKRSRRTSSQNAEDSKSPLDDIRNRIRATRDEKEKGEDAHRPSKEELRAKLKRSSKHAPQAMSTKHQVTRKRIVVEPSNAPKARDPRFDSVVLNNSLPRTVGAAGNAEHLARQRYGFLKDYRASELSELRKMMGQTKNPEEKERIKRAVTSMSDRQRAYERKERERKIRSEHKKRERELIREGKKSKAFHLKDSEVKKQAQLERYKEMSGRQRQKALEHKRKKMASKEAREMPWTRRGAEE